MQTRRTPATDLLDPQGLGDWGAQFPFYAGDRWQDYVTDGRLVKEVDDSGFFGQLQQANALLFNQPAGTLYTNGAATALQQIQRNYYAGSPTDLPKGFYTKGARLQIVKPDYTTGKVTRYTFRLRSLPEVLRTETNPKIIEAAGDFLDFILDKIPLIDPLELEEVGTWVLTVTESTVLRRVDPNQKGVLDGLDLQGKPAAEGARNLLPFIVSGAGLVTGSPLLIGAGLVLRFFGESRK